jgi:hypothetical protein
MLLEAVCMCIYRNHGVYKSVHDRDQGRVYRREKKKERGREEEGARGRKRESE